MALRPAEALIGFILLPARLLRRVQLFDDHDGLARNDLAGDISEAFTGVSGMRPQQVRRAVHVDLAAFGQYPLGLFDDDPTGQRRLQLSGHRLGAGQHPVASDADHRQVSQRLPDRDLLRRQDLTFPAEQVQRPEPFLA